MTSIYQVDSFASEPFKGNPAAVCILPEPTNEAWMQNVAMEMNLSETAFLHPVDGGFSLRWFTPTTEVDLCGHATLASAHILWETGTLLSRETAKFYTRSGLLTAVKNGDWIEMDFPAEKVEPSNPSDALLEALGVAPAFVGKNRMDYFVEVPGEELVRELQPDFSLLARLPARGVIVTSRSRSEEYDFVSRCFYPAYGIPEDPVTGSAHCALAPYWAEKLGKQEMIGYQASGRGGFVRVKDLGERTLIAGQAVTVLRGEIAG